MPLTRTAFVALATLLAWGLATSSPAQSLGADASVSSTADVEEGGLEHLTESDHFKRGTAALEAGQVDRAVSHLAEAVRLKPEFREAWYNLALAYGKKGAILDEVAAYRRAIELDPEYAKAWFNLGVALEELGRLEEAAIAYEKAGAFDGDAYDARMNLGVALAMLGRLDAAVKAYRSALEVNDQVPAVHYNLGIALSRVAERLEGKAQTATYEEALSAYAKAVELEPRFSKAEYNRALVFHALKRTEEEIQAFKRAIELQPRYPQALYNLAYTYEAALRYEEALIAWRRYVKVARDFPTEQPYLPAAERAVQRLQQVVQASPPGDDEEGP